MVSKNKLQDSDNKTKTQGIKDPVCGMDVSEPSEERKFEYKGQKYFF